MADLPDYYTQAQISEAEAASVKGGLDINKSATPVSRQIYFGTDTGILYVCVVDGVWTGFDASILTQGILTLYANMLGGGFRITNIADPTAAQDAATRAYVLAQVALRLALTGGTMAGNIVMGGNKVTGLGAPAAQDDALRYNRLEIRNAEIAAAAAIAYSKLNLTGAIKKGDIEAAAGIEYSKLALAASIVMADFAAAIQNAANGIVVLDASADVPDAQIPNLAAGKITSDRFPVDRLPAMTDEKIWKGTGANVEEVDMPVKRTFTELVGGEKHTAAGSNWEDWDISGIIPAGAVYALVECYCEDPHANGMGVRKNGSALVRKLTIGVDLADVSEVVLTEVDANRVIETYAYVTRGEFSILGYWS